MICRFFFLYGHKLIINFDSSRARECSRAKQICHKNIQKFSSRKARNFRCPHSCRRDHEISLSCRTIAASRAPTGGEISCHLGCISWRKRSRFWRKNPQKQKFKIICNHLSRSSLRMTTRNGIIAEKLSIGGLLTNPNPNHRRHQTC